MKEILEKTDRDEEIWNRDLIEIIRESLSSEFPDVSVFKGKVLKDIFLYNDEKFGYSLQFGFVDQDIVIYDQTMDISDFKNVKNIFLHNNKDNKEKLVIPKIICELKYDGVTSHGLITYSNYASDIKSIFPQCKYILAMMFQKGSSINKLFRHGRFFDKIIFFNDMKATKKYVQGSFRMDLMNDDDLRSRFDEFLEEIRNELRTKQTHFVK